MPDDMVREKEDFGRLVEARQSRIRKDLAKQYIQCRKEKRLTQTDIAEALGVKRPNITRFENGAYNPTLDMLVKIAACMGKELEIRLVDRKEEKGK